MQLLKKLLVLALLLAPISNSFAHDDTKFKPFVENRLFAAGLAVTLFALSMATGEKALKKFEQVVEENTKAPKSAAAKHLQKTLVKATYLAIVFTSILFLNRYAHTIIKKDTWLENLGLKTGKDYVITPNPANPDTPQNL